MQCEDGEMRFDIRCHNVDGVGNHFFCNSTTVLDGSGALAVFAARIDHNSTQASCVPRFGLDDT